MTKSKVFICISVSFALGILAGSEFQIRRDFLFLALGLLVVLFAFAYISRHKTLALAALFLFCAGLGSLRIYASQAPNQYQSLFDTKQQVEGYVVQEPDVRQNSQMLTIKPDNFSQNILVTTNFEQDYFYGDRVAVDGKIEQSQAFNDFDYPHYLERFNIYALVKYPKILILKNNQLSHTKYFLLQIKTAFVKRINSLLQQPQAALMLGLIIGARKSLPPDIVNNFNATGTSHIIAISGFNITIIIYALSFLTAFLGRKWSFWFTLALIVCFVVITGASASVIRAAIMGSLFLLSSRIGRQYHIQAALFASAFVMLLLNPKILFWDIGFQLSFAATLGIISFMPFLEQLTQNWPLKKIKSILFTTLAAIASTLPLMLLHFGTLSLVAPVVNILVLTFVPLTMLFGFLIILPFAGVGFAYVSNLLLLYILRVTEFFAHLPYSNIQLKISAWAFIALLSGDFGLYFLLRYFTRRKNQTLPLPVEVLSRI